MSADRAHGRHRHGFSSSGAGRTQREASDIVSASLARSVGVAEALVGHVVRPGRHGRHGSSLCDRCRTRGGVCRNRRSGLGSTTQVRCVADGVLPTTASSSRQVVCPPREGVESSCEAVDLSHEGASSSHEGVDSSHEEASSSREGASSSREAVDSSHAGASSSREAVDSSHEGASLSREAVDSCHERA